jgi:hypothetical protein
LNRRIHVLEGVNLGYCFPFHVIMKNLPNPFIITFFPLDANSSIMMSPIASIALAHSGAVQEHRRHIFLTIWSLFILVGISL